VPRNRKVPGKGVPEQGPTSPSPPKLSPDAQQRGVLNRPRRGGRSIWDWLDLIAKLAISVVIALATVGFGAWQSHLADVQNQRQNQVAQQSALNQQRAAILQTYIDNMQGLLLNYNNPSSAQVVSEVERGQTLTTLRRLNAGRNVIVIQFLRDAHLIWYAGCTYQFEQYRLE